MMASIPRQLKLWWWYCTDAAWRMRYRAQQERIRQAREGKRRAMEALWRPTGGCVASGPFQGLKYLGPGQGGEYPQKLLGTYEKELSPVIETLIARQYDTVIDIGAAEGYYVCGLAKRMPATKIVAFEAQSSGRQRIAELAKINGVQRQVAIRGFCTADSLRETLIDGRAAVVCDIEGAEADVLDPAAVPGLGTTDLLVEVHEHFRPGVRDLLRSRFEKTHRIEVIWSVPRTLTDLPSGIDLDSEMALAAMEESRGTEMEWYWMTCQR